MNKIDPKRLFFTCCVAIPAFLCLYPFLWMFFASFKSSSEIISSSSLLPKTFNLDNYYRLFTHHAFLKWYGISLSAAATQTFFTVLLTSLAGYAFAKHRFKFRKTLFVIMMSTSMIPFTVILIPLYMEIYYLGGSGHIWAIVLPFVAPASIIFLMIQFLESVHNELIDAGRMDGASELKIYWFIVMPLLRTGLATVAILTFLNSWNNFLWPLIILSNETHTTLPVGIQIIVPPGGRAIGSDVFYGVGMAASTLTSLPIILFFAFMQRHFLEGISAGAVKS